MGLVAMRAQGLWTYGTLGWFLGLWHGWLAQKKKNIGIQGVLALIGSALLTYAWVILADTVVSHVALIYSL